MNGFADDEIYPAKSSAGGINAYYVESCEHVGHRPAYCICVNKIQHFLREHSLRDSPCEAPIKNGACPALHMRKEELKADRAIYFIHRDKLRAHQEDKSVAAMNNAVIQEVSTSKKKKKMLYPAYVQDQIDAARAKSAQVTSSSESKTLLGSIDDSGYAKAINAAIEKVGIVPEPGESFIEMARRALG